MDSFSNCKELWASLSATGIVQDEDRVKQLLESHKQQLLAGVLCFKKSKSEQKAKKSGKKESENLKKLISLISETISVDGDVSRRMLEQYLMYQFRGEGRTIERYLTDSVLKTSLVADIWTCVLRETIFLLHCLKLVLSQPISHPYNDTFCAFAKSLDSKGLHEKLLLQLESLKEESPPTIQNLDDEWLAASLARRLLICHCFLFVNEPASASFVLKLFNLFKDQSLAEMSGEKHQRLSNLLSVSQTSLLVHLIMQLPKIDNDELVKEKNTLTQLKDAVFSLDCKTGGLLKLAYNAAFYTGAEEEAMALVVSAFEENQFEAIHNIMSTINDSGDKEVSSKVSGILFELLELLVERYYVTGFSSFPMFFRSCGLVLSQTETCSTFWLNEDCALRALLKLSLDYFPHLSQPVLHILKASAKAGQLEKMLEVIGQMDMYTEEKKRHEMSVQMGHDNDVSLMEAMSVMDKMLTLPAGTQGVLSHQQSAHPLVHWNIKYNFWDALYYQLVNINAALKRSQNCDLEKAALILKSINCVLKAGHVNDNKMTNVIYESFLLVEIACQMAVPPAEILAEGLKILRSLFDSHQSRICEMAAQTRLVPCWLGPGPPSLLGQVEYGVWQHTLLGLNFTDAKSSLVRAYLRFLLQIAKEEGSEGACESVLAAGLLVVSQNILPGHVEWLYPRARDEETIGVLCLQFLQALLNKGANWEKLVVECLLKTKTSSTLMHLAASGEDHIESVMVREPSFLAARSTRLLLKIRLSLSLLNQALQRRHLVLDKGSRECILLQQLSSSHQVEKENFYFRLSLYLQSRLHPYLPTLAVKVLQQVFEVLPVSLRFYLRMEDSLIRNTLEMHLLAHDSYPPLRAALLDLLTNCVKTHTQSALLVLMFTQQTQHKEVEALPAEGAKSDTLDFILSTLVEASEEEDTVDSPVYRSAIDFCQACWAAPVLYVLKSIVNSKDFWTVLTTPLVKYKICNIEAYIQLLRILFIEIVRPKFPGAELDKLLETLVQERLLPWNQFVMDQLKETTDKLDPKVDALVRVWSNFLVAVVKKRRCLLNDQCISDLTNSYLNSILHVKDEESFHLALTAQVLLHLLNAASSCKDLGEDFTSKIVKVAELTSRKYIYLKPATRTTLLSILAKSLTCNAFLIEQARGEFEYHVGEMVCRESLEGRRLGLHPGGETMVYILALRLLQLAGNHLSSFGSELTFSRLTKDAVHFMKEKKSAVCPEIILKTLVAAASNPQLAPSIGLANLKSIWMALRDLKMDTAGRPDRGEWDKVYEQGLHLAGALVTSPWKHCQAEIAIYLTEHRSHLVSLMTALRASQDRRTLLLSIKTVQLLAALSGNIWNNHDVLNEYAAGVLVCLDLCVKITDNLSEKSSSKFSNPQAEASEPFQFKNEKNNLLMTLAEGCMECLMSICQPTGQLSRKTLLPDWRQSRLVLLDTFLVHHCNDHMPTASVSFGTLLKFAFNCLAYCKPTRDLETALPDKVLTLKALKRCINLILQQARVQILRQSDCTAFRNTLRTEMDALFETVKVNVFKRHGKLNKIECSGSSMPEKGLLLDRTPLTPISNDTRVTR